MDEIDSKYIVLKYYAIPETAINPSFSIVKYKTVREIATREQGDTRREERRSSNALFTATVLQPLVCFTTIYRFIFFLNSPKRYPYGTRMIPSVRPKFVPV